MEPYSVGPNDPGLPSTPTDCTLLISNSDMIYHMVGVFSELDFAHCWNAVLERFNINSFNTSSFNTYIRPNIMIYKDYFLYIESFFLRHH